MIHEEMDQILEQAFKNVMRKSKFFQANRKILRNSLTQSSRRLKIPFATKKAKRT